MANPETSPEILLTNLLSSGLKAEGKHPNLVLEHEEKVMELMTRRKEGNFQNVKITLAKNPTEEIHAVSQTPIVIDFPTAAHPAILFTTTSSLKSLRRKGVSQNSLEALDLISPYETSLEERVHNNNFWFRTLRELREISRIYDGLEKGRDSEKRKELRELRDRLVIDRIITPYANNDLPDYLTVGVSFSNQLVQVRVTMKMSDKKNDIFESIFIEGPDVRKYSAERNQKLSVALARLGEI